MDNNTGVTEEYKVMVERLEREKRGMYEEMKEEREKRQRLEQEVQAIRQEVASSRPAVKDDNLEWVTEFAKNGKTVLRKEFDEFAKPFRETNQQLSMALLQREALDWLAEEEGTTVSKVRKSGVLKDLERIGKEKNLSAMPLVAGTQAAYEFLKVERKQKEEEEKARNAAIDANGTQTVGSSAPVKSGSGRVWKESEIAAMDLPTFQHHQKDITLARSEGRLVADISGSKK